MEHYLINPVSLNPLEKIRIPGHTETVFRRGSDGRFGPLRRGAATKRKKAVRKSAKKVRHIVKVARRKAAKHSAASKVRRLHKSGILTSLKKLGKSTKEKHMNPLMLINKRRKKSARKAKRSHRRARKSVPQFAMNPKRRSARRTRRTRRNPISFRKGSAAMSVVMGAAYGFGGGIVSAVGVSYVCKLLPQVPMLQTPLGKIGLRVLAAVGLYQLHRVKVIGKQNATFIAIGALIPAIQDVSTMVGADRLLPAPSGVGLLPKAYRSGTSSMGLIMPPQNMAGAGEGGW